MNYTKQTLISGALLALLVLLTTGLTHGAENYKLDPDHTSIVFRSTHFGAGHVYGRFNDFSGHFIVDAQNPTKSWVEIKVKAQSVDTANQKRDQHLRSPDFFNVKQFPWITFKGQGVKKVSDNIAEVKGDLTLHGITKTMTVKVERIGEVKDPWGNQRLGVTTSFKINRSDFGMKFMPEAVGDEIMVTVATEGILQSKAVGD